MREKMAVPAAEQRSQRSTARMAAEVRLGEQRKYGLAGDGSTAWKAAEVRIEGGRSTAWRMAGVRRGWRRKYGLKDDGSTAWQAAEVQPGGWDIVSRKRQ